MCCQQGTRGGQGTNNQNHKQGPLQLEGDNYSFLIDEDRRFIFEYKHIGCYTLVVFQDDSRRVHLCLVKQYRRAEAERRLNRQSVIEVVGGRPYFSESFCQASIRESEEELEVPIIDSWQVIDEGMYFPGNLKSAVNGFIAIAAKLPDSGYFHNGDGHENIEVLVLSFAEFNQKVRKGEIAHLPTITLVKMLETEILNFKLKGKKIILPEIIQNLTLSRS
jgi:hypothetical protein